MTFKFLVGDVVRCVRAYSINHRQQIGTDWVVRKAPPAADISLEGDEEQPYDPHRFALIERPWTPWAGGENPVPGMEVEVKFRPGNTERNIADRFSWRHHPHGPITSGDIIAYRVPRVETTPLRSYQDQPEHADLATLRDPSRLPALTLADIGVGDIVRITTEGRVKEIYDDGSGLSLDIPDVAIIGVEQITSIAVITRAAKPLSIGDMVRYFSMDKTYKGGKIIAFTSRGLPVVEWSGEGLVEDCEPQLLERV